MRHPTPALLRAYARTDYEAAGAVARIGRRSAALDALLRRMGVRQGGFVTAWNPFSRARPDGWNARMQRNLVAATRRLPRAAGRGLGQGWAEDHLLLGADPRRVRHLARRFRQGAIVTIRCGAPARLRLLGGRDQSRCTAICWADGVPAMTGPTRLGFFTRLLDQGDAAERYRVATQQILHAEVEGFDSAWIAQHHFHEMEGGLPAPFVFLAQIAARTTRIRLGTGVVTLPMEMPIRVAEDAAVLDLMSGGRLELGVGSGGNPAAFAAFGMQDADRRGVFREKLDQLLIALEGKALQGGDRIYPQRASLRERIWYATFSVDGARHAGEIGAGLMLSRTQPRPDGMSRDVPVAAIQEPMIDAYLAALPPGVAPRILASRSVFVADTRAEALRWAEIGLRNYQAILASRGQAEGGHLPIETLIRHQDVHIGTPAEVAESLLAERVFQCSTDLAVQVHSVDPPHAQVMRSIELMAREVAPMIGLRREPMRKVA